MGVVSACIPSLRPLVTLIIRGTHRGQSLDSMQTGSTIAPSQPIWRTNKANEIDRNFIRLEESLTEPVKTIGHNVSIYGGCSGGKNSGNETEETDVPLEGIQVKTEITLISSDRLDYDDRLY